MTYNLTKKIGVVSLILGIAAVAELLSTIILGRVLSPELFGRFKFFNTVVLMLSSLLLFGQNMSIIRVFGQDNLKDYNWKKFIGSCLVFSAMAAAIGCILIGIVYNLINEMFFAYFAIIAAVGTEYHSAILRSQGKYSLSMFLNKTNSIIFFFFLMAFFCIYGFFNFWGLVLLYTIIFLCITVCSTFLTQRLPVGKKIVSRQFVTEGLILFFITISYTIMVQIDQFFITKMLGYAQLADYVVVITVTRGFELVATALWFVMMPHYAKDYSRSIRSDSFKVGVVALIVCVGYVFMGQPLLHLFFKGKFDHSSYLLAFFIAAGFFRIIYAIPAGIIGGRLPKNLLKLFLVTCLLGIILNLCLNYFLIPIWGLRGAAASVLVSWIFRVVSAYYVVMRFKSLESQDSDIFDQISLAR